MMNNNPRNRPLLYLPRGYGDSASFGSRTLRDRQTTIGDDADRALANHRPFTTARMLVQVFDGGSMPTAADHYFACHPVQLAGNECEGCAATPTVDTSTTVLVDVLGGVPVVGDILVAYAVGGRWVAELTGSSPPPGKPCAGCTIGNSLTVTDSFTTTALTYTSGLVWTCCYQMPVSSSINGQPCTVEPFPDCVEGFVTIRYTITFAVSGGACAINVDRNWGSCVGACCYTSFDCGSGSGNEDDTYSGNLVSCLPVTLTLGLSEAFCAETFLLSPLSNTITIDD